MAQAHVFRIRGSTKGVTRPVTMALRSILYTIVFASLLAAIVTKPSLAFSAPARAYSDASYDAVLQRADEATTRNDKGEATRIFADAAQARLRCARQVRAMSARH
jgi:hypothetical protein